MTDKRWTAQILLLALAVTLAACSAPSTAQPTEQPFNVSATDALGNQVVLSAKPMHIVSLTLGTDEILLDLVGPERLAAVTHNASDTSMSNIAARIELTWIKNTVEANASPEQILAMEPDLVVAATYMPSELIDQLRSAGVQVYTVGSFNSIESMQANILALGQVVGEEAKAQAMVDDMKAKLDEVAGKLASSQGPKPTVLYLSSGGWVAGSATTVDDIITRAGGVNAAAQITDWKQVSQEEIIQLDPDVVILAPYVPDEEFLTNPAYAGMKAIKNGQVVALPDAHMSATSQYIVLGVEDLARYLYPDVFGQQ